MTAIKLDIKLVYHKIPIMSPGLIFVLAKGFLDGLISGKLIFRGLIIRRIFRLRFGGLIFARTYHYLFFLGGEGGRLIIGIL